MQTERQEILTELKILKIQSVVKSKKREIHVKYMKDFKAASEIGKKYHYSISYGFIN